MNYSRIKELDIANGEGVRVSLFVSGCPNHCKGCFNPETWNYQYGEKFTVETSRYIKELLTRDYIKGLSLLGGEPFAQSERDTTRLINLAEYTHSIEKDVWAYSGFTYEQLTKRNHELLKHIDVLVDGPFIEERKNPSLRFRGSENQRIIYLTNNGRCGI